MVGLGPDRVAALVREGRDPVLGPDERAAIVARLLGPQGLSAHASSFDRRDVLRAVVERVEGADVATAADVADAVLAHPDAVWLDRPDRVGGDDARRFSTAELVATEARAVATAAGRAGVGVADPPPWSGPWPSARRWPPSSASWCAP